MCAFFNDNNNNKKSTQTKSAAVEAWLREHLEAASAARGIVARFSLVAVTNPLSKPGPVFNALARSAASRGAHYMYRVNDDTEFVSGGWTSQFVAALKRMGGPAWGVVGPSCAQGNRAILTHDFTASAHLDIFGDYYPPVLTDWWKAPSRSNESSSSFIF